jgi:hypothetical protein
VGHHVRCWRHQQRPWHSPSLSLVGHQVPCSQRRRRPPPVEPLQRWHRCQRQQRPWWTYRTMDRASSSSRGWTEPCSSSPPLSSSRCLRWCPTRWRKRMTQGDGGRSCGSGVDEEAIIRGNERWDCKIRACNHHTVFPSHVAHNCPVAQLDDPSHSPGHLLWNKSYLPPSTPNLAALAPRTSYHKF